MNPFLHTGGSVLLVSRLKPLQLTLALLFPQTHSCWSPVLESAAQPDMATQRRHTEDHILGFE